MSLKRVERKLRSIIKQIAKIMFQEQKFQNTAIKPILYRYRGKAINNHPNPICFMYGALPRMNGVEPFFDIQGPLHLIATKAECGNSLSLKASRSSGEEGFNIERETSGLEVRSWRESADCNQNISCFNEGSYLSIQMIWALSVCCIKISSIRTCHNQCGHF